MKIENIENDGKRYYLPIELKSHYGVAPLLILLIMSLLCLVFVGFVINDAFKHILETDFIIGAVIMSIFGLFLLYLFTFYAFRRATLIIDNTGIYFKDAFKSKSESWSNLAFADTYTFYHRGIKSDYGIRIYTVKKHKERLNSSLLNWRNLFSMNHSIQISNKVFPQLDSDMLLTTILNQIEKNGYSNEEDIIKPDDSASWKNQANFKRLKFVNNYIILFRVLNILTFIGLILCTGFNFVQFAVLALFIFSMYLPFILSSSAIKELDKILNQQLDFKKGLAIHEFINRGINFNLPWKKKELLEFLEESADYNKNCGHFKKAITLYLELSDHSKKIERKIYFKLAAADCYAEKFDFDNVQDLVNNCEIRNLDTVKKTKKNKDFIACVYNLYDIELAKLDYSKGYIDKFTSMVEEGLSSYDVIDKVYSQYYMGVFALEKKEYSSAKSYFEYAEKYGGTSYFAIRSRKVLSEIKTKC